MRVNVIKLEVEGESHEIRDALPSILNPEPTGTVAVLESVPTSTPALIEMSRDEDGRDLGPAVEAAVGAGNTGNAGSHSEPPHPPATSSPRDPVLLDKPREWEAIPPELRVWNATGITCHIAKNEFDPYSTWCGHDTGRVRPVDLEPRTQAQPCGNCVRRLEEAKRDA